MYQAGLIGPRSLTGPEGTRRLRAMTWGYEPRASRCDVRGLAGLGVCASIRVIRTAQGYYSINRRMTPAEGWGDA